MKKNYDDLDLKEFFKYILSCKKIIIIIIFTFISLTLAFKLSTPKFYKTTSVIKAVNQISTDSSSSQIILESANTPMNFFYEYYMEILSDHNLYEYLNTININNKDIEILFDRTNLTSINKLENLRIISLRSKNFKENLDDILNKYLIYTEEKVKKNYKVKSLNYYYSHLEVLTKNLAVIKKNLEIEDSTKLKNYPQINEYNILVNQILSAEKSVLLIEKDYFFSDSFILKKANEVILDGSSLLFILLMSLISSLFISIFVISIKYILTK